MHESVLGLGWGQLIFLLIFFIAYVIQAITGFAGNMLAMPFGIEFLGFASSVVVLNVCGCMNCGWVAVDARKHINWHDMARVIPIMAAGMFVGIWLDTKLSFELLVLIYGVLVLAVGLKNLIWRKQHELPTWAIWALIPFAGIIQGMYVSGGALLVIFALQRWKDKDEFRGSMGFIWTVLNFTYAVQAILAGNLTAATAHVLLFAVPLALLATWVGNRIARKVSVDAFKTLTYVLLVIIGLRLLFL